PWPNAMTVSIRSEKHAKANLKKRITLGIIAGLIGFSLELSDASKMADRISRRIAEIRKWFELLGGTANVVALTPGGFYNRTWCENKSRMRNGSPFSNPAGY